MLSRVNATIRELLRGFWQPVGMCCGLDVKGLQLDMHSGPAAPDEALADAADLHNLRNAAPSKA
jgi:hypothetical protein